MIDGRRGASSNSRAYDTGASTAALYASIAADQSPAAKYSFPRFLWDSPASTSADASASFVSASDDDESFVVLSATTTHASASSTPKTTRARVVLSHLFGP